METMYFVEFTVKNKETGAWAHRTADNGSTSDIIEAKRVFGSEMNRLYGSADFDFVNVLIITSYGNVIMSDTKDARVAPEPETEG